MRRILSVRLLAEVLPAPLFDLNAVVLGRPLDVGESLIALLVRHALNLVEPGQRVQDRARGWEDLVELAQNERALNVGPEAP